MIVKSEESPRNVYEMLPTLTVYSSERKSNLQKDMMGKNPNWKTTVLHLVIAHEDTLVQVLHFKH